MTITEKYLEALKQCDDWVTAGEWALKVSEVYPALLEKMMAYHEVVFDVDKVVLDSLIGRIKKVY